MATSPRRPIAMISAQFAVLSTVLGCGGSSDARQTWAAAGWHDASVDAVSRPATGAGVTAVTALGPDGRLRTVVTALANGRRLWSQPTTMAGRPAVMGVTPPAIAGPSRRRVVASVEQGPSGAVLTGRDPSSGRRRWLRPVGTTFGPAPCGDALCVSESTAGKNARFAVLDAATGTTAWTMPGVAEVEWADRRRVVVLRMAADPVVEARDLAAGGLLWSFPIARALGRGADLSGGWSFGALDDGLVGYLGPYQARQGGPLSAFGFFSVRLDDGGRRWARPRLLRVYPSANPAVALIAREVTEDGRYGGFTQLDPRTGRSLTPTVIAETTGTDWRPAFTADLSTLGLLSSGRSGRAYDLRTGRPVAGHVRGWSFCTMTPSALKIPEHPGFYPVATLCPYDLKTGQRLDLRVPPPGWYTGAVDGWRVWRDGQGGLRGLHDAKGTVPGMYG